MAGAGLGIGAGASVVGGVMQAVAASQARKAMEEEQQRELQRQARYRGEAFGGLEQHLPTQGVEQARYEIDRGAQRRQDFYNKVFQSPLALQRAATPRTTEGFRLAGQNRANLGGYSDWALEQMIKSIRMQDELNRISNFAAGTAQVFPYRMYDAQHSADELAFWGNLISSVGGTAQGWGSIFGGAPSNAAAMQGAAFSPSYGMEAPAPSFSQDFNTWM